MVSVFATLVRRAYASTAAAPDYLSELLVKFSFSPSLADRNPGRPLIGHSAGAARRRQTTPLPHLAKGPISAFQNWDARNGTLTLGPMNRTGTEYFTILTVTIEDLSTLGFSARPGSNASAGKGARNGRLISKSWPMVRILSLIRRFSS